jgi:5,10-methylenetetrahydromethanopterin reductase
MSKVEFGLMLQGPIATDYVRLARMAEELGFGTIWIPEDPGFNGAFALASAVAACTSKIKIGFGVLNPYLRHPALIAMEIATLDRLCNGRVILGLGASVKVAIEEWLGVPHRKPLTAVREGVDIIRQLLRGERLTCEGQVFRIHNFKLELPSLRSEVPIYLGVMAPKALELAGKMADGVLLNTIVADDFLRNARAQISTGRERAGRADSHFVLGHSFVLSVAPDKSLARAAARQSVAWLLSVFCNHRHLPIWSYGDAAQIDRFAAGLAKGEPAVELVTESALDALAIAGTSDYCCQRLEKLIDAGVTHPAIILPMGCDYESSIRQLANSIFPHFL